MKINLVKALLLSSAIFAGLPVLAQQSATTVSSKIDVLCIQSAIDTRDTTLANMVSDWSSSTKNALEARRDALKGSWSISDYKTRRLAQRKAWSDYRKVLRSANTTKTKERSRTWKKFEHDRRQCEGAYSPEMTTGSTYDAHL
ncbi:hypothetical protein [Nitrosovibrio tenuis]|nr:hypothetical protein [Nitrosovibrio tenuis]